MLNPVGLQQGIPQVVVNAAAGTGVGSSAPFTFPPSRSAGQNRNVQYMAEGTFSVATMNVEVSYDGVNWEAIDTGVNLATAPAGSLALAAGVQYRFNIETFTGTSITIAIVLA